MIHYYVKRVVAVPGQKVQIIDGMLYVDGVPEEEEIYDKMECIYQFNYQIN